MEINQYQRFEHLNFDDFRKMATDTSLSCYEKIGFPNSYRQGKEGIIFEDILSKLSLLTEDNQVVLDIGPGCSELPHMLIELCRAKNHQLIFIDSEEMLSQLPDETFIEKINGYYPNCLDIDKYKNKINIVLGYSILHYIFIESSIHNFLDTSLSLIAEGGQILIGDIPNVSKRKRFFSSQNGIKSHQLFTSSSEIPDVKFNEIDFDKIDDSVIISLIARARNQGFDAYTLPQHDKLPMSNRREDILIIRP
jgi:hypothetical protein